MLAIASTALNGGSMQWRTGVQEANPEAVATGTLLVTFTLNATFAPASVGADGTPQTLTANTTNSPQNAVAGGVAGHFRLLTSGGRCVMIGDIGTSGSDLNLATTTIVNGAAQTLGAVTVPFAY